MAEHEKAGCRSLDGIYSLFGLDFREDGDLIAGLKMHIHGLIDRVKAKAHMQDVFVEEIKRKYLWYSIWASMWWSF